MNRDEAERLNKEGIERLQENKLEEAGQLFLQAIEADSTYALPYCHIGNILASVDQSIEAIDWFQKAIDMDAEMATAYYGLGSTLYKLEKWAEAIHVFEQAEAKGLADGDLYFMLGMAWLQEGQGSLSRSLAYFQLALDKNPNDLEALFQKGLCAAQLGHIQLAKDDFQRVVEEDPSHADALYNLGVAYAYEQNKEEGLRYIKQALAVQPDHILAQHARKQIEGVHEDGTRSDES